MPHPDLTRRHYLDHASTSPVRPEAIEAMLAWLSGPWAGDPGRVHTEGRMVRQAVEEARGQVAALVGARPRQVVLTSGATEAINAAVWGAVRARPGGAVVCPAVEHSAVQEASRRLAPVVPVPVDRSGRVDLAALDEALDQAALLPGGIALVHCQAANHEVGTVQPVAEVTRRCRQRGVLCHVDAATAAGHVPVEALTATADLVSLSAHKMGGPPGAGALVLARGLRLDPLVVGGDQERGRRAGMENVAAIAGFGAVAALLCAGRLEAEAEASRRQTEQVMQLAISIDGVSVYGDPTERVPHITCLGVDGVEAEAVLLALDQAGIAAHSGSACSSEALEPSPVLAAMGVESERSLRISVGWSTADADLEALTESLPAAIGRLRALRGAD